MPSCLHRIHKKIPFFITFIENLTNLNENFNQYSGENADSMYF